MRFRLARRMSAIAAVAVVYFFAAKLGLTMAFTAEQVTMVWPPTGIALAAMLLGGHRVWPGIWIGAFLANATAHEPVAVAASIAMGNTLEAVSAAWLLRRFAGIDESLERFKSALGLVVFGALLSTGLSATIGVISLCVGGVQPWGAYRSLWFTWWLGDAMGDLLVAPVLLTWTTWPRLRSPRRFVEAAALLMGLAAVSLLVFTGRFPTLSVHDHPLEYTIFPFVIWAALRFGHPGAALASLLASGIAIGGTVHSTGPFAGESVTESLILLQIFMAVVAATGLLLGAVVAENHAAASRRHAQHETTRVLTDAGTLSDAIPRILQAISTHLHWDVGLFWQVDLDRRLLHCVAVWSRPSTVPTDFEGPIRQQTLTIGSGLAGRVWASETPFWISDVAAAPECALPGVGVGFRAAFGFPIRVDGAIVGVLEFHCRDVRPVDRLLLQMSAVAAIGSQIEQFVARKRAEQHVVESEARKAGVLDAALDCIVTMDHDGRVIEFNPAAERTFGHRRSEVLGRELASLILPPATREFLRRAVTHNVAPGEPGALGRRLEMSAVRADGTEVPVELSITRVASAGPPMFTAYLRDISEHKRLIDELAFRATHDWLTNLLNRAAFMERLGASAQSVDQSKKPVFAVLLLDIDRFKAFNDDYGHLIGDQLLVAAGRRLEGCARPNDTVARLGGDEFAVLLEDLNGASGATTMADRILQALSHPFNLDGRQVYTSVSVGIALSSARYSRPESLLRDADTALYVAKALGRGRYQIFDPSMRARAQARLALEADLTRALQRQEFLIYYQPIVSLQTAKTTCLEALVRWQHPRRGLVAPGEFVSVAEETGLIVPIGAWVLHAACAEAATWQGTNDPPPSVAINVSARQFQRTGLPETVQDVLTETKLAPQELALEITESLAMNDIDVTVETLKNLSATGIRLAIDDFGTGYSSLSCLKHFPIDTLKIDQSFVRHMTAEADDTAIVAATIAMAHTLELTVVAEGVETEEQLRFLQEHQCDAVQGHLVSVPLPIEVLQQRLRDGQISELLLH